MFFGTYRDTTPEDGKTSVVMREAIDLTRKNRIDLESLRSLQQVQKKNFWQQTFELSVQTLFIVLTRFWEEASFKMFLVVCKLPFIRVKDVMHCAARSSYLCFMAQN